MVFGVLVEGCCSWSSDVTSSMFVEYDFYRNISESFQSFGVEPDWSAFVVVVVVVVVVTILAM